MKRLAMLTALMLIGSAPMSAADPQTWFGFSIGVGNAPPPPRVVFAERPTTVWVPGNAVYVVPEAREDMFLYSGFWYVQDDGYWYRSRRWDGPFVAVDVRRVPRAILSLPAKHWKHHPHGGPPGQMKKHRGRH